jgi:AraC family transcriptional activator of pobA
MVSSRRKEPPPSAHSFSRFWDIARFLVESDFAASAEAVRAVFVAPRILHFVPRDAHAVRIGALLAELATEFATPESAEAPVTTWLARAVLWRLGQACAAEQPDAASKAARHQALFTRFLLLVEAHFLEHWPVAAYASRLGMTPARLNRLTRAETGKTALELIHTRLTREACRRLIYVAAPVARLAQELGFEDPAYFCRFFKRATGSTPQRYRQQSPD